MGQGRAAERHASWHLAADVEAHAAEGVGCIDVDLAHDVCTRVRAQQRAARSQLGHVQAWREERREQERHGTANKANKNEHKKTASCWR